MAAMASPHSTANIVGWRISARPAQPGSPREARISAELNSPPDNPPATPHNATASQPRPRSRSAELWPKYV